MSGQSLFILQILAQSESGSSFLIAQYKVNMGDDLQVLLNKGFATYETENDMMVVKITEKGRQEVVIDSL